jgi:hypothetical protein
MPRSPSSTPNHSRQASSLIQIGLTVKFRILACILAIRKLTSNELDPSLQFRNSRVPARNANPENQVR